VFVEVEVMGEGVIGEVAEAGGGGWEEQEQERALSFSRNLHRQHVEDRRCEVEASIQEQ